MSRFYAEIQGSRGAATRQGSTDIYGHIRGWNIGVFINCFIDETGEDVVAIDLSGGSHNPSIIKRIGRFKLFNGGVTEIGAGG